LDSLLGPYVHDIDPILGSVLGVHLWWYGLSYTLGFLNAHLYLRRRRARLGLSLRSVYDLSLCLTIGVLFGGRFVEVVFYEWPFYGAHLSLIPCYWLGGMATHGLLLGGLLGVAVFAWLRGRPFLAVADALAIPAAFILGVGRLGNFIDGRIVGSPTTAWWGVQFPDVDGFRHPVVLYDGLKNLLIIPVLLYVRRRPLPSGVLGGLMLFLYGFLRIPIDVFREYTTTLMGLATGQGLNVLMALVGLLLLLLRLRSAAGREPVPIEAEPPASNGALLWRRLLLAFLLLFSLVMPSDLTRDVPVDYGRRHAGLVHSAIYPRLDTRPDAGTGESKDREPGRGEKR
jgi:phosphatidylglycerol:prolipoprotein diacylglycerol transferase